MGKWLPGTANFYSSHNRSMEAVYRFYYRFLKERFLDKWKGLSKYVLYEKRRIPFVWRIHTLEGWLENQVSSYLEMLNLDMYYNFFWGCA